MRPLRNSHHDAIEPDSVALDDQLWPVIVALALLASFGSAVVVEFGRFDEARVLFNAWTYLATLGIATLGLMWTATRLDPRRFRRGVLFSALVSLLAKTINIAQRKMQFICA